MRRTVLLICMAVVFCGLPVNGAIITIQIEAVVDGVGDPYNFLEGRIIKGDLITGTYTYDTDTPDSNPLNNVGDYEHFAYPSGFSLRAGGLHFMTDSGKTNFLIEIVNDYLSIDAYSLISYGNLPLSNGTEVSNISWGLRDDSAAAISNADLMSTGPVPTDWGVNYLNIKGEGTRDGYGVQGHVTSAVVIPEPGTMLLVGLGGLLLCKRN